MFEGRLSFKIAFRAQKKRLFVFGHGVCSFSLRCGFFCKNEKVKKNRCYSDMAFFRKKTAFLLLITALICSNAAFCPAQNQNKEFKSNSNSEFILTKDPNVAAQTSGGFADRELVYKFIFSVFLVIAVGATALYFSKRFGGKIKKLRGKKVQVSETIYLGPRKALHLLTIGRREILIGSTNENISMIADVTETFSDLTGFVQDKETNEQ